MVVQIDVDNTITWAPGFFAWLSQALRRDGHRVRIVTARGLLPGEPEFTQKQLRDFGLVWDSLVLSEPVPDIDPRELPEGFPADLIYLWPKLRAAIQHEPDLLFDDSENVSALFARHLPRVKVLRPQSACLVEGIHG